MYQLSKRSKEKLQGVHPDLVRVVMKAIQVTAVDFAVLEGVRTLARQKELVTKGASKTMNSRHLTGHAVDLGAIVAGEVSWDWDLYVRIAESIKKSAKELKIPIEWGGNWRFKDGPHFQLPFKQYPKGK